MGNNHDKYFGKDKRKILILGLEKSGKTEIMNIIVSGKQSQQRSQHTKDLNIKDARIDNLSITFFELAGGERQRIFWKQHFQGTQGIIFVIDSSDPQDKIDIALQQIVKLGDNKYLKCIPIAVCAHKSDIKQKPLDTKTVCLSIKNRLISSKMNIQTFATSKSEMKSLKQMMKWLLKQTKPL